MVHYSCNNNIPIRRDNQKGGILLYDVQKFGSSTYFVYSEDHLSSDNLCVSVLEAGE